MGVKHYPPEFKADTIALCRPRPGATVKPVTEDLGSHAEGNGADAGN